MKKFLLAGIAFTISVGSASAADLPRAPINKAPVAVPYYNWTGFYLGVHLGYGWDSENPSVVSCNCAGMGGMGGMGTPASYSANGVLGGLQAGYNYQVSSWVFGVEGEVAWTGMSGSTAWIAGGDPHTLSTNARWLDTAAGRIGYAFDRTLVYAKGGAAWEHADFGHTHTMSGPVVHSLSGSATRFGWLIGGGIEQAFTQNLSAKIEYNYIDFGSGNITTSDGAGSSATFAIHQHVNVLKAGLNYRFGAENAVVARY
jgi:outer membrane immunogenic protein